MSTTYTIGAFATIFDEKKRVLLCHRTDMDMWNAPGGRLNDCESPWEAVVREVKEETGLEVQVQTLHGIYAKNYTNDLVFHFICTVTGGRLTLNAEADKLEYFDVQKLPPNTLKHHIERIKDALKTHDKTLLKFLSE